MKHASAYRSSSRKSTTLNPYDEITRSIVKAIEDGATSLGMPWHQVGNPIPRNASTEKPYRGINILALWAAAVNNGWTEGVWATYRQWEELGCKVKRGEKSSPVVFWDSYTDDQSEPNQLIARSFAKRYAVFNCAQVDGYCPNTLIKSNHNEKIAAAEAFFLNLSSDIRVGGNEAGFSKSGDFIRMPGLKQFMKSEGYYSVLSHEHIHWSGHKSRLNRDLSGRFGDSSYAMEELIAELGAAFLCSHLGVKTDPREDHAGYVASWLRVLNNDNRADLYRCISGSKGS